MADFSKEYAQLKGWTDWDFSLESEYNKLGYNKMSVIICEGLDIKGIAKDKDGNREVWYKDDWLPYEKFIEQFKEKLDSPLK